MSDQEVRQAVSEQVVQSAETIENLRIKVETLRQRLAESKREGDELSGLAAAEIEGLKAPDPTFPCEGCGKPTVSVVGEEIVCLSCFRAATFEDAVNAVRAKCKPCGGAGSMSHPDDPDPEECMYCGVPIAAIRAAAKEQSDG